VLNWGFLRRWLSRAGNFYARMWLRFPVQDATSGFRAFRTETLRFLDLQTIRAEGYAFQIETTWRVHRTGGTIEEIPIEFVERASGRSKMSRAVILEALVRVTRWGLKDLFRRS
jgi:dolichol-phosphate mannosyltransferase